MPFGTALSVHRRRTTRQKIDNPAKEDFSGFRVVLKNRIAGETIHLSAGTDAASETPVGYWWDFLDGTSANGTKVSHAYTRPSALSIRLTVDGVDGVPFVETFSLKVGGNLTAFPDLTGHRRFPDPTDR
jgi:hypothetical protein